MLSQGVLLSPDFLGSVELFSSSSFELKCWQVRVCWASLVLILSFFAID